MCVGTYIVSYSCGHVVTTPGVCLQDLDPHYRCEPRGMKITQPNGRCVECYARDLAPDQKLTTTVRFNPDPMSAGEQRPQQLTPQSSMEIAERNEAIVKWVMDVPELGPGSIRLERETHQSACSIQSALSDDSYPCKKTTPIASTSLSRRRFIDPIGYEADDESM